MSLGWRNTVVKAERLIYGWHSAAVIYRMYLEDPWFLLQWSRSLLSGYSRFPSQLKCLGGGRKHGDESPLITLEREVWEEAFITLGEYDPILLGTGGQLSSQGNHAKFSFLVPFEQMEGTEKMRRANQSLIDGTSLLFDLGFYHWKDAIRLSTLSNPPKSKNPKIIREATEMILGRKVRRSELTGV
ncbi:MAG: hypothetical protein WAW92_02035 [Minisyncoccia bacterium]